MKASKTLAALVAALAVTGCDTSLGPDLSGLWIADSYEYRSGSGETVDLIERDGASFSLSVDRFQDVRRVTTNFNDGVGGERVTMSGEVSEEEGVFTFPTVVYQFSVNNGVMTLTSANETFDFGSGPESATLTIRLTRL